MAATSISKSIAAPKKRGRGLIITRVSFVNAKTLLGAGAFYILFIALVIGFLYPAMSQLNFSAYLTSNAIAGLIGTKLTNFNFSSLLAVELYSSLYALIWGESSPLWRVRHCPPLSRTGPLILL